MSQQAPVAGSVTLPGTSIALNRMGSRQGDARSLDDMST